MRPRRRSRAAAATRKHHKQPRVGLVAQPVMAPGRYPPRAAPAASAVRTPRALAPLPALPVHPPLPGHGARGRGGSASKPASQRCRPAATARGPAARARARRAELAAARREVALRLVEQSRLALGWRVAEERYPTAPPAGSHASGLARAPRCRGRGCGPLPHARHALPPRATATTPRWAPRRRGHLGRRPLRAPLALSPHPRRRRQDAGARPHPRAVRRPAPPRAQAAPHASAGGWERSTVPPRWMCSPRSLGSLNKTEY